MNQGELWWCSFRPPNRRRPVLILTRDSAVPYLTGLTVAPVTSTIRDIPSEVKVGEAEGLRSVSVVNCDNLQTVTKDRLSGFIGRVPSAKMRRVRAAIAFALGFDALV